MAGDRTKESNAFVFDKNQVRPQQTFRHLLTQSRASWNAESETNPQDNEALARKLRLSLMTLQTEEVQLDDEQECLQNGLEAVKRHDRMEAGKVNTEVIKQRDRNQKIKEVRHSIFKSLKTTRRVFSGYHKFENAPNFISNASMSTTANDLTDHSIPLFTDTMTQNLQLLSAELTSDDNNNK